MNKHKNFVCVRPLQRNTEDSYYCTDDGMRKNTASTQTRKSGILVIVALLLWHLAVGATGDGGGGGSDGELLVAAAGLPQRRWFNG